MTRAKAGHEVVTSTLHPGATDRRVLHAAIVRCYDARVRPSEYRLAVGSCRIGSGPTCDIVIEEPTVSRVHAELSIVREGVLVEDLGSRNGTFYLGQRIHRVVLAPGARIQIGAVTVAVDPDDQDSPTTLPYESDEYRGIIGGARGMRELFGMLQRLGGSLATVLVEGESGVGKELVARALHAGSRVSSGPVVVLNCGALPRELIGSELFGHRRGAFTGAAETRRGAFESADGGTLFLDEIGELPIEVQPMLLRAIELGEVRQLGCDTISEVNVRIIAATNRDLADLVAQGRFREDLFYRLAVVRLRVPPLSERVSDIERLALLFARQAGLDGLPAHTLEQLKARAWPGNVRELRNTLQAYAALGALPAPNRSKTAALDVALRDIVDTKLSYADQKAALHERFTKLYLRALYEETGGNLSVATKLAGLDRGYLTRLLAKYGLVKTRGPE